MMISKRIRLSFAAAMFMIFCLTVPTAASYAVYGTVPSMQYNDALMWIFAQSDPNANPAFAALQYDVMDRGSDIIAHAYPMASSYMPSWSLYTEDPSLYFDMKKPMHHMFDSSILGFDPGFFQHANPDAPKRYLIFGTGFDSLPSSSKLTAAVDSDPRQMPHDGFFSLALLSEEYASELSSNGFVVVPDRPLDLHRLQSLASLAAPGNSHTTSSTAKTNAHGSASENDDDIAHGSRFTPAQNMPYPNKHDENSIIKDATRIPAAVGLGSNGSKYDATGSGITVAIVDTGVDFSNPDIQHSLARDSTTNHPIMLDPDGQGIVITNHTFYANIDQNGILKNTDTVPEGFDSVVYATEKGVFLDIVRNGSGSTLSVYNSLYPAVGNAPIFEGKLEQDMKIGNDNRNYIKSQSGSYRLGVIFQMGAAGPWPEGAAKIQVVPVLVVDSTTPGTYDTIIPDMSSSWLDYVKKPGAAPDFDFDFTDETPIILGNGNEFLIYDSDDDGRTDYSAGTVGARVLDVFSVINATNISHYDEHMQAVNGTLLPALDPEGRFFGVMTDSAGHGTSSSAVISSTGKMKYDIYNDTDSYIIRGVAPDAKILPVKALWLGDIVYGWLWSAGFDNHDSSWTFSGVPRADIISNSWGISTFPNLGAASGYDMLSLILDMLATPRSFDDDYPGVLMITSAGNSGHGYGTVGTPSAASFAMSVGASTNNVFVGYGPFKDQPRFGASIYDTESASHFVATDAPHNGHIVDFSSRGPSVLGDVKPDISSMGAAGFVPRSMMGASQSANTQDPFRLFGGTSMAAPIVAGVGALVMSELTENLLDYDPFVVRNILMSTARDTYNDPFVQGAGLADAGTALDFVHGNNGVFVVSNDGSYKQIRDLLNPAISSANIDDAGIGVFELPDRAMPMTTWFAGHLQPGERATVTFTVENPSSAAIDVAVLPQVMSLAHHARYNGTTIVHQQDPILNDTGVYIPNYVRLADVYSPDSNGRGLGGLLGDGDMPFSDEASLLILNVYFEFPDFMNMTTDVYADDLGIASLYLYDWVDANDDSEITSDELLMVTRGGSWGTVQEIRVSDPAAKFEGVPTVGIYPVPQRYSYWVGPIGVNATALDYTISANYYTKEGWDLIWPEHNSLLVNPQDVGEVDITLVTTNDTGVGVYQGFINFESDDHVANVPVSFVVKPPIHDSKSELVITPDAALSGARNDNGDGDSSILPEVLYHSGYTRGSFDVVDRYMTGDWRNYYFDVYDESINAASVEISWDSPHTSISVFATDPAGKIIQTNVPSGVFGRFLDWPSVDWLGATPFSEGGGFYPVSGDSSNDADTFTLMTVPINGSGTYTIITHTTLFGGKSTTEPVSVVVKFYKDESSVAGDDPMVSNPAIVEPAAAVDDVDATSADATVIVEAAVDDVDATSADSITSGDPVAAAAAAVDVGQSIKDELAYDMNIGDSGGDVTAIVKNPDAGVFTNTVPVEADPSVFNDADDNGPTAAVDGDDMPVDVFESTGVQSSPDSSFGVGVTMGIVLGAAIGVVFSFIILRRSKNTATTSEMIHADNY